MSEKQVSVEQLFEAAVLQVIRKVQKSDAETRQGHQPQPHTPRLVEAVEAAIKCATRYHGFTFIVENAEFEAMRLALAAEKKRQELVDAVVLHAQNVIGFENDCGKGGLQAALEALDAYEKGEAQ